MPHDCHGRELQPGDEVVIRFRVLEVHPGSAACNVGLRALRPDGAPGDGLYLPHIACNAALTSTYREAELAREGMRPEPAPFAGVDPERAVPGDPRARRDAPFIADDPAAPQGVDGE